MSLSTAVLLVLTLPLVLASEDPDVPAPVDEARGEAQAKKQEAERTAEGAGREAGQRIEEARTNAQNGVGKAEDQAGNARLAVEDAILSAWDLGMSAYGFVYDYAVDQADRIRDFVDPVVEQTFRGGQRGGEASFRSQSSDVAVVRPYETTTLLWVAAASTGSALLLAVLVRRILTFAMVPLLSRISHDDIYNNEARRTINELVLAEAGLCLNEIVTRTGYSRNAVSYHLFVLEKEEAIVSVKDGKYRRYFTRNGKYVNGAKNVVAALRNGTTLKLAQAVLQRPGAIQRDLCVELGATPSATCWHAKRLLELGVIRKQRVANTVQYFPGETLAKYDLSDFGLRPSAAPAPALA